MLAEVAGHHPTGNTSNGATLITMATAETDDEDPIVIVGKRPPLPDWDGGGLGTGGGGGGGSGGGGAGGGSDGGGGGDQANPTPCVETSLKAAGATLQEVNNAALAASNAIAAKNDEDYEYSSILYSLNGKVGWTQPYTQNLPGEVNWAGGISQVPSGGSNRRNSSQSS